MKTFAEQLIEAEINNYKIEPFTDIDPKFSTEEAYQVQSIIIQRKLQQGRKILGKKIGLTSIAMQQLLGVEEPDYGQLLDSMMVENEGVIPMNRVLQPKVEAEIAFVLKKDIVGPKVTLIEVLEATNYVLPALEIVDSRIKDWRIKLPDTIADNASSGFYVLGNNPIAIDEIDLVNERMELYKNEILMNVGIGAAALGNPAICVAWLANKMSEFGVSLKKGEVILSGALSAAVEAKHGDYFTASFAQLGEVSVQFG
ncbi:2-keto-4-pentenoate hydratase [Pueribacillus theae]|uniref:2-keto-4-pentenoate hydratase n=1 Tax=Pueribacillus theae TaxID=2171751 RepID=A0A2U1K395_9BACI|nr:2-keto-4-pentenoate hydratase [Pueribacillus theae]